MKRLTIDEAFGMDADTREAAGLRDADFDPAERQKRRRRNRAARAARRRNRV